MDKSTFLCLYKSLVRSHLDYGDLNWFPVLKKHIRMIENVQRRATRILSTLRHLSYSERLQELNLPTLLYYSACYWYRLSMHLSAENSAGYLQRVQIFLKPFNGKIFTYKKHRNSSAMVIYMDFLCQYIVTDIKQTCLGQGLGVTITARKRTFKVKNLGHTSDLYI